MIPLIDRDFELGKHGMASSFALVTWFVFSLSLAACTSDNPSKTPAAPVSQVPAPTAQPEDPYIGASAVDRRPDLARHAALQLTRVIEALNLAAGFKVDERMAISNPTDSFDSGCRLIRKVSPKYDRTYDTDVEELSIDYVKCLPERTEFGKVSSATYEGHDGVTLVYEKPYPRSGAPDFLLGYPTHIGYRSGPAKIVMQSSGGVASLVTRTIEISANRVDDAEGEQWFDVNAKTVETFTINRGSRVLRETRVTIEFVGLKTKMKKDSLRHLSSAKLDEIVVRVENFERGVVNDLDLSGDAQVSEVRLKPDDEVVPPSEACESIAGRFPASDQNGLFGTLIVSNLESVFSDKSAETSPRVAKSCSSEGEILFLDDVASLFL